jgi:hypothetical protein
VVGRGRGWRGGGEMTQTLYAHVNKQRKKKKMERAIGKPSAHFLKKAH